MVKRRDEPTNIKSPVVFLYRGHMLLLSTIKNKLKLVYTESAN